jgi:hypothetical protein
MRVTIIRDDGLVGISGTFRRVDLSTLPPGVRAVQWEGAKGHIEYDDSANTLLDNIEGFKPFIDLWTAAAPPPSSSLPPASTTLKTAALARINTAYQDAMNAIMADYPEDEVKSWPKQEAEARAWLMSANAATPWIDGAAASRGITKAGLVDKILANAALFAPLHGALTGKRQKLRDQIIALGECPTQKQLDAIQW